MYYTNMAQVTAQRAGSEAGRLRSLVAALVRRFSLSERADVECCGLTVAQAATLEALGEGPLRLGALAARLGISPSTLTRNLARLEAEGLVARAEDAEDARASRVRLSARGARAAARVEREERAFAEDVLARLGPQHRDEVMAALADLLGAVREASEACCPGAFDHLMEGVACVPGDDSRRTRERKAGCGD